MVSAEVDLWCGFFGGLAGGAAPVQKNGDYQMKKTLFSLAAVVALGTGAASAADLKMAYKAAPPVYVSPWDIAFGSALASD